MKTFRAALLNLFFLWAFFPVCAEVRYEFDVTETVAPGIVYREIRVIEPFQTTIHVLICDLSHPAVSAKTALAKKCIGKGREHLLDIAKREKAIAAINGNYFGYDGNDRPEGTIRGVLIRDGQMISTVNTRDPWLNACLGVTEKGYIVAARPVRYIIELVSKDHKKNYKVLINALDWSGEDYIIIYDRFFGGVLPQTGGEYVIASPVNGNNTMKIGEKLKFRTKEKVNVLGQVPDGEIVLIGIGTGRKFLNRHLKIGKTFSINITMRHRFHGVKNAIGGFIRMVVDGKNNLEENHPNDAFEQRSVGGRTSDGKLLLACGKSTCFVLAELLENLGVEDAILLDGGDSSGMVVHSKIVFGGKRPIVDALLIFSEKRS